MKIIWILMKIIAFLGALDILCLGLIDFNLFFYLSNENSLLTRIIYSFVGIILIIYLLIEMKKENKN